MPFFTRDQIKYYTFPSFEGLAVNYAVFTRLGGVSPAPYHSLNVGGTVGDDPAFVAENRARSFTALGREITSMHDVWQVHSSDVVFADAPRAAQTPHVQADILLTDNPQVTLYMRFADCVPILLFDPVKRVTGLAHAGWVGTVKKVAAVAIDAMVSHYHSNPADVLAGIGPSICVDHYPVGFEVFDRAKQAFGGQTKKLFSDQENQPHFNLWKANQITLEQAGVEQIEVSGLCTACHPVDWFSHRGENGKTGRFGAMINLRD